VSQVIKLSSPATREFWEIPVLFEDEFFLAINKPAGLFLSPDRNAPERASLMQLLHRGIAAGTPWAKSRGLAYLSQCHRLDSETSGVLLLAKSKPVLIAAANLFGSERVVRRFVALVRGSVEQDQFTVEARIAPHPLKPGLMEVNSESGKRAVTEFVVRERFAGYSLLEGRLITDRPHQIRVHLRHVRHPLLGDAAYRGPPLWLSSLKTDYRLKPGKTERPLLGSPTLHCEQLAFEHPMISQPVEISAPLPKDLVVALKYLRRYATGTTDAPASDSESAPDLV
jgi:23S rRNA pseudouridine1911/1915/1917 synthase